MRAKDDVETAPSAMHTMAPLGIEELLFELARAGEREEALVLVRTFSTNIIATLQAVKGAVATRDWACLRRAVHALKGGALNMGANELADACRTLETCASLQSYNELSAHQVMFDLTAYSVLRHLRHLEGRILLEASS